MFYLKERKTGITELKETLNDVIKGLETYVEHKFGQSRKAFMDNIISLNYGVYDDKLGKYFAEHLKKYVEMGVVQETSRGTVYRECDIHEYVKGQKYKEETGD